MNDIRIIEFKGKPTFVIIPYNRFQELYSYHILDSVSDKELISSAVVKQIKEGIHPIKAFREYRELSQRQLAKKINKTSQYISSLERNVRKGTLKTLKAIAQELKVNPNILY